MKRDSGVEANRDKKGSNKMEQRYRSQSTNWGTPSVQLQQTVTALIETLIKPESLKRDLFFALLLIAMKDNEFQLLKKIDENMDIVNYIQANRTDNQETTNEAMLTLSGFPDMPMKIIVCPLNDVILIVATIPQMYTETYSTCVKINKYILTSELGIPMSFANLEELFLLFKEKIVIPIRSTILNYHAYPSGNLSGLPDDILYQILLKLHIREVLILAESCKRMQKLISEDSFWFQLYKRDFSDKLTDDVRDWRDMYKDTYVITEAEADRQTRLRRLNTIEGIAARSTADFNIRQVDSRWEVFL